jgi:hypothetical protein
LCAAVTLGITIRTPASARRQGIEPVSKREQLGALLIALRDGLAADSEGACSAAAEPEPEAAG